MDMFIYGSKYIIRNINLQTDGLLLYDTEKILNELELNQEDLKKILILSGTDYNLNLNTSLIETLKWFQSYKKEMMKNNANVEFYDWLFKNTKYIEDKNKLDKTLRYFTKDYLIELQDFKLEENIKEKNEDKVKEILKEEGFVFL